MQNIVKRIDNTEILNLASREYGACISLFMPEILTGRETQQNLTRYRDLCRDAAQKLERYGVADDEIQTLLAPLKELEQDEGFWKTRAKGLAIFRAPDLMRIYMLPVEFDSFTIVDKHFYIRPFLAATVPQSIDHVLLLNPEDLRLISFEGNEHTEQSPPDELASFKKFMEVFEFSEHAQFHSAEGAPRRGDAGLPIFQGEGTADDESPEDYYLGVYYRRVKNWLKDIPSVTENRLYLVGDAKNIGVFTKAADDLPCTFETLIDKNVNAVDMNELVETVRDRNQKLAETGFEKSTEDLLQIGANDPNRVLTEADEILAAAHSQRVQTLFIPASSNAVWGHFNETSHDVTIEKQPEEGVGEELINLAAIRTLQNNGEVVPLADKARFSDVPHFAAICRW